MKQPSNTFDSSTMRVLLTAKEFLTRFEPGALNLLPDPEKALGEDTLRAAALATQNGIQPAADGRYPLSVWERIYPL
jgi:hypothetical protein